MMTTNSKNIYEKLLLLRTHGITKQDLDDSHGKWYYEMKELGFNYRLTDFQASLGITQLAKNQDSVKRRNEISSNYKKAFKGKIKFQDLPNGMYNAHHLFVIEVENRKDLYDFLHSKGVLVQIHYIPIHKFPYYKKIGYADADLKNSEKYYKNCLSLPMYPTLTSKEQSRVIKLIIDFLN